MTRKKIIETVLIHLLVLVCNQAAAQILPNTTAIPRPYKFPSYFEPIINDPVRQVTFITKSDIENGLSDDTTRIYFYSPGKTKISEISYEKNKPYKVYHFKYRDNNLIEWDEAFYFIQKDSRYVHLIQYNDRGLQVCSRGYYLAKNDTIGRTSQCLEYDSLDNIIKMTNSANNYIQSFYNYYYSGKKLTRHDIIANPGNIKNYQSTEYNYTEENLLKEKTIFNIWQGVKKQGSWNQYYYEGNLLVKEIYPGWESSPGETTVQYWYNKDKSLSRMLVSKDSLFKDVVYEYENSKVKHIAVKSNAWNYLNGEFIITLSSVNPLTKTPYLYEEQYSYDAKGYITEKKMLLNGIIKKVLLYKIEYY